MRESPLDLVEADLNVERIQLMLVFITNKLFINHLGIFQFMTILDI